MNKKLNLIGLIISFLALIFSALKLLTDASTYYYDYHEEVSKYAEYTEE